MQHTHTATETQLFCGRHTQGCVPSPVQHKPRFCTFSCPRLEGLPGARRRAAAPPGCDPPLPLDARVPGLGYSGPQPFSPQTRQHPTYAGKGGPRVTRRVAARVRCANARAHTCVRVGEGEERATVGADARAALPETKKRAAPPVLHSNLSKARRATRCTTTQKSAESQPPRGELPAKKHAKIRPPLTRTHGSSSPLLSLHQPHSRPRFLLLLPFRLPLRACTAKSCGANGRETRGNTDVLASYEG